MWKLLAGESTAERRRRGEREVRNDILGLRLLTAFVIGRECRRPMDCQICKMQMLDLGLLVANVRVR